MFPKLVHTHNLALSVDMIFLHADGVEIVLWRRSFRLLNPWARHDHGYGYPAGSKRDRRKGRGSKEFFD